MNIVTNLESWQELRRTKQGQEIGFVPTMGNLHEGHLSLCKKALAENEFVIVSIFINPAQFNQEQDYISYPRTLDQDKQLLESIGVDALFLPPEQAMYPDSYEVRVTETSISSVLEGEFRPGHFTGMLTIVLKLLNLIAPQRAYFGEKDYQQLLLIKKMVLSLFLPIEIVACPTIRAPDGLALSSRNARLTQAQRTQATCFAQTLQQGQDCAHIIQSLLEMGFRVEYVKEAWGRRLAAVWLDEIRLIDNISIE